MAKKLEDMGCHSICIKDMAGLLKPLYCRRNGQPYQGKLCGTLVDTQPTQPPVCRRRTLMKAIDAGVDMIDTSISSMSLTYCHSPTETFVAIMEESERATGLDLELLEEISLYFS